MTYKEMEGLLDEASAAVVDGDVAKAQAALKEVENLNVSGCSSEAYFRMGEICLAGDEDGSSHQEAENCFAEAAKKGSVMGAIYRGAITGKVDPAFIERLESEAGEYEGAAFLLGSLYEHGDGVKKDEAAALKYYRLGYESGDAEAACRLGEIYNEGLLGQAKDEKKAYSCFKAAAEKDNPAAMFMMGRFLQNGMGGAGKNDDEALSWYKKAMDAGEAGAENIYRFLLNQKKAAEAAALEAKRREEEQKAAEERRRLEEEARKKAEAEKQAKARALAEQKAKEKALAEQKAREAAAQKAASTPAKGGDDTKEKVLGVIIIVIWIIAGVIIGKIVMAITKSGIAAVVIGFIGGAAVTGLIISKFDS